MNKVITITSCGRICLNGKKINESQVFAGQNIGIKETEDKIWLVSFMDYVLGILMKNRVDHFKPYFCIKKVKHEMCNAHILRELIGIIEADQEEWAKNMFRLLKLACRVKNKYTRGIPNRWTESISKNYFKIIAQGLQYHKSLPPLIQKKDYGIPKRRVGHNLVLRLEHYNEETLRFLYNPEVPFTNNQAEQDLRMMKVKQKISGCFRSFEGAKIFCKVRSLLSTARKQGWNIWNSIEKALDGEVPAFLAA